MVWPRGHTFELVLGDLDPVAVLQRHDHLDQVEAVRVEVLGEPASSVIFDGSAPSTSTASSRIVARISSRDIRCS